MEINLDKRRDNSIIPSTMGIQTLHTYKAESDKTMENSERKNCEVFVPRQRFYIQTKSDCEPPVVFYCIIWCRANALTPQWVHIVRGGRPSAPNTKCFVFYLIFVVLLRAAVDGLSSVVFVHDFTFPLQCNRKIVVVVVWLAAEMPNKYSKNAKQKLNAKHFSNG